MTRTPAWCVVLLMAALAACSKPQPPEKERPPVPKSPQAAQATQMRDAIQAPIDKARNVEADARKAAEAQRAAIEAQTGN